MSEFELFSENDFLSRQELQNPSNIKAKVYEEAVLKLRLCNGLRLLRELLGGNRDKTMESMPKVAIIFVEIIVYLNIVASYHLLNVDTLSTKQRVFQGVLVWVVPFLGSAVVICFHLSEREYVKEQYLKKGLSPRFINLLTFITVVSGFSGGIFGIHDASSHDGSGGFDGGGGDDG